MKVAISTERIVIGNFSVAKKRAITPFIMSLPTISTNTYEGHFYEQGLVGLMEKLKVLMQLFPKLERGYERVSNVVKAGGITTIADLEVLILIYY